MLKIYTPNRNILTGGPKWNQN